MRDFKARAGWLVQLQGGSQNGRWERRPWAWVPPKTKAPEAAQIQLAALESEEERFIRFTPELVYERKPLGKRVAGAPKQTVPGYYYEYVEEQHAA